MGDVPTSPVTSRSARVRAIVISTLLAGSTVEAAATAAKVNRKTITRLLADPDFQREFAAAETQVLSQAITRLTSLADGFIGTLAGIAFDAAAPANARVQAAKEGLSAMLKGAELLRLVKDVEQLKQIAASMGNR